MAAFATYRSFNDKVLATELYARLHETGIPVEWESTEGLFDASFANNDILNVYKVKLRQQDFARADELLWQLSQHSEEPEQDYYLFFFSDQELKEVLIKSDEWNEYDRYWAQQLLTRKGINLQEDEIIKVKSERIDELKKPWTLDKVWVLGAVALLAIAFYGLHIIWTGGVIFVGLYISFGKKTLPDGTRVMAFSPADRMAGKIILSAGLLLLLFILFWLSGFSDFQWFF